VRQVVGIVLRWIVVSFRVLIVVLQVVVSGLVASVLELCKVEIPGDAVVL